MAHILGLQNLGFLFKKYILPYCNYGFVMEVCRFFFLLKWLYQNLKKVPKMFFGIYAALFVESFFLVNARQPFFWIIILLGTTYIEESRSEQSETKKNMEPNLFSSGYPSRL